MDAAELFVGRALPDLIQLGPEYDAYQMRRIAEELVKLSDDDLLVCMAEIHRTATVICDRLAMLRRKAA